MDPQDLLHTALRASLVYLFILFVVRLLGKRSIGNLSAFDLIVALMIGEVSDEIIFGDVTLQKGFVAVVVIALWHFVNAWTSYRSKAIDKLTAGSPRVLVEHGQIHREALAAERLSEDELWSNLRMQGVEDLAEVRQACLEPSGHVSVLLEDWARPIEKRDLAQRPKPQVA
jgi:uncharacterized membrane protein YcaP (DUF421 family)